MAGHVHRSKPNVTLPSRTRPGFPLDFFLPRTNATQRHRARPLQRTATARTMMVTATVQPLKLVDRRLRKKDGEVNRAYRVALICGALPLLVGVSIFLLWLITRWDWLMVAGVCTLYGGVAVFLLGVLALARFCWLASRPPDLPRQRLWRSTLAGAGLLLSNFPVAGGITATVIAIETRYTVVVHNDSQQPLDDVRVFGGGCDESLGSIQPGGTARRSFWIQHDGSLEFRALSGTTVHATTIDGYVTGNMGGHMIVTINNPDGTISVRGSSRIPFTQE